MFVLGVIDGPNMHLNTCIASGVKKRLTGQVDSPKVRGRYLCAGSEVATHTKTSAAKIQTQHLKRTHRRAQRGTKASAEVVDAAIRERPDAHPVDEI